MLQFGSHLLDGLILKLTQLVKFLLIYSVLMDLLKATLINRWIITTTHGFSPNHHSSTLGQMSLSVNLILLLSPNHLEISKMTSIIIKPTFRLKVLGNKEFFRQFKLTQIILKLTYIASVVRAQEYLNFLIQIFNNLSITKQ